MSLFLSTLSLRRATIFGKIDTRGSEFLSTLSLRRATIPRAFLLEYCHISIHALLAESDEPLATQIPNVPHFYPRSPCGERLLMC